VKQAASFCLFFFRKRRACFWLIDTLFGVQTGNKKGGHLTMAALSKI
jgi:hypothetical protein